MNVKTIPAELKNWPQWVFIRRFTRDFLKKNPDPYSPETWRTFRKTVNYFMKHQHDNFKGIGFVFRKADPFVGIDLDACVEPETGNIMPWAQDVVDLLNSYTEISQSGTGLHIIVKGMLYQPFIAMNICEGKGPFTFRELWLSFDGTSLSITGEHLKGTPSTIETRQVELMKFLTHYKNNYFQPEQIYRPEFVYRPIICAETREGADCLCERKALKYLRDIYG